MALFSASLLIPSTMDNNVFAPFATVMVLAVIGALRQLIAITKKTQFLEPLNSLLNRWNPLSTNILNLTILHYVHLLHQNPSPQYSVPYVNHLPLIHVLIDVMDDSGGHTPYF